MNSEKEVHYIMKQTQYSWTLVIVTLFLFFPVGICLLALKINSDRGRYQQNGKGLRTLAIVLFVFAAIYLLMGLTGELKYDDGTPAIGASVMMVAIMGGGGAVSLWKSRQLIRRGQEYDKLLDKLYDAKSIDLDPFCKTFKLPFETVAADLEVILNERSIQNVHIDRLRRTITVVIPVRSTRTIICPHCGGKNDGIEVDAHAVCSYCDSQLQ